MSTSKKIRKGTTHLVTWAYDSNLHQRHDVVSQHRSYEAAVRKAKRSSLWRVDFVNDWIFEETR